MRLPVIITASFMCLALGAGGGILCMAWFGYHWEPQPGAGTGPELPAEMGGPGCPPGMLGPHGGMAGHPGQGNPRLQLAALVVKLDLLTNKPLTLSLTEEQKIKLLAQLQGLADRKDLDEAEAWKRLEAVLEVIEGDKELLRAAGYHWPNERRGVQPGAGLTNPFKDDTNAKHLKSLQDVLAKGNRL